jgi:hypothetical protein
VTTALSLIAFVALLVPWRPTFVGAGLDESWALIYHHTFFDHLQHGRDLVFTYGPLGILDVSIYHPRTYPILLVAWIFFAGTLWYACRVAAARLIGDGPLACAWLLLVAAAANPFPERNVITMFLLPAVLLLWCFYVDPRPWSLGLALLTTAAALSSLAKTPYLLGHAMLVALIAADQLRRRRFPVIVPLFAGVYLLFYTLSGQHLSMLAAFLRNSGELVSGYSVAMSTRPPTKPVDLVLCLVVMLLLLAAVWRRGTRETGGGPSPRPLVARVLPSLGMAWFLFQTFKWGYTRHDRDHASAATLVVLFLAILYLPVLWPRRADAINGQPQRRWRWRPALLPAGILCLATMLAWATVRVAWRRHVPLAVAGRFISLPGNLVAACRTAIGRSGYPQRYDAKLAEIRRQFPLPALTGPTDVYPSQQGVAVAHGLDYAPRPVFQSYAAFTPHLAKLNAEHLLSPRAADNILFEVHSTIDKRVPSGEDGLSWPHLLSRYDLAGATDYFLILRKSRLPRQFTLSPVSTAVAQFGKPLDVPRLDQPVWVTIDVRPTLVGRAAPIVLSSPPVLADITTRDGRTRRMRLLPTTSGQGFLLSPLVEKNQTFAALSRGTWRDEAVDAEVTSITLASPSGGGWAYRTQADIQFFRLSIAPVLPK